MSECVVRMEMPINCLECPMYDWNRQKLCCNAHLDLRPIPNGGVPKPDWCPIVCSLPEGHGRLIDADAMAKDLNYDVELDAKALDDMSIVGYARERFQFDKNRKQDCIRYLSGQKTIVPAERSEE